VDKSPEYITLKVMQDPTKLGALPRPQDPRDILLGSVQAPVAIPATYIPDISWLTRNYQGQTPTCGAHAFSHFQAILEHALTPSQIQRYTPRFSWIEIKLLDGLPLADGTDMRSIFKAAANNGAADFEPLENDVTLPIETYSEASAVTPDLVANAAPKKISSYAFGGTDFQSLCQAIYQNTAVLLLIKCDNGFWGTTTPTFTTATYGHFICAYGYDENNIYAIDSADPSDADAFKIINREYITSTFFFESGTAVDIPTAVKAALTSGQPIPASVQTALTAGQITLAGQILNDIEAALALIQKEI
jgi:hypothetical protein